MIGRFAFIALAAVLALAGITPATADRKSPADPGAQICELDWQASFGKIELKQTWSGAGELTREDLSIRRDIPVSSSGAVALTLSQTTSRIEGKDYPTRLIYLSFGAPYNRGKNQRLVIAIPDGEPLVLDASNGWLVTPLTEAQLTRLLEAKGRLTFRFIKADQRGKEKALLAEGWFDLSGFAGQPMAGLTEGADRARTAMAQARAGGNPPCAKTSAAEMNAMDSDEPIRKWLTLNCDEAWDSPLGTFGLTATGFSWRPRPRDGVIISLSGALRSAPSPALQRFLIEPNDPQRYGPINVMLGNQDWGANYRVNDPALRERQSLELRRGKYVARKWLSQNGSTAFLWSEFSQMLAGDGDFELTAHDTVTGATLRSSLPWSEILAVEEELRTGQARMRERERDPMTRCKAVIDAEYGGESIIVT